MRYHTVAYEFNAPVFRHLQPERVTNTAPLGSLLCLELHDPSRVSWLAAVY